MSQSYLKLSIAGANGCGKSGTASRLAIGISKELCGSAPVLAYSSDERWRFYQRTMFEPEGIQLTVVSGRSLSTVQEAIDQSNKLKPCVLIHDDLTVPWKEGISAFSYDDGYLTFERREQLMRLWRPVLVHFQQSPFHAIGIGRKGFEWENLEDEETGRMKLEQGNSKFNAGGSENFGFEADVEAQMSRRQFRKISKFRRLTGMQYVCDVIKDATVGVLNGKQFVFNGQQGIYKPGDYRPVFEAFRQYLELIPGVQGPQTDSSSTKSRLISGMTAWGQDQKERKKLLEELDWNLKKCFPGGEGKSKLADSFRGITLERLNGYVSWSRMEDADDCPTAKIERTLCVVMRLRNRIEDGEIPTDQPSLNKLLTLAINDVDRPDAKKVTLLEAMGLESIKAIRGKGPQPITKVLDAPIEDEVDVAGD